MRLNLFLIIATSFLLGIVASNVYAAINQPFGTPVYDGGYELPSQIYSSITGSAVERISPTDHVSEEQILVYSDRVVLDLQDAIYAKFTDTNSMDPVLDANANALEIVPQSPDQLTEGDIIAYRNECTDEGTIIHRIVKQGEDQLGTYYIAKGDNNPSADPCKIRFADVKSVVVAIIY